MEDQNTIPITRPQSQHGSAIPDVVKQVLEKEGKLPQRTTSQEAPHESYADIPAQFVEHSKYPTTQVSLVSEGILYPEGHPLSSGVVELKQVTAFHEDILSNEVYLKKGIVLIKLLESLLVDKRIKPTDFLVCDLNGIFISIRRMSYGDEYTVRVKCPGCGTDQELIINLSKFQPNPINYDIFKRGINEFEFITPTGKNKILFKILTQKDDDTIDAELKALSKVNKEKKSELTTRLKYSIISVDSNDDKGFIKKFIENDLLAKDCLALRRYIKEISPDIPREVEFECINCEYKEERMAVPITLSFFWPNS